jgi:hypothetical protein
MKTYQEQPFAGIIQSQQEEIGKHKWIEGEKAGRGIGRECAACKTGALSFC